jgi:hypothetical protein
VRYPDAVFIIHPDPAAPDAYGEPTWTDPVAAQGFLGRESIYFGPGTDIRAGDRVLTERGLFAVDGDPGDPHTPTGRRVPIRVKLVRLPDRG